MNDTSPFFVRTDSVVLGRNPEMADISNPYGFIYGYCALIISERPDGARFVYQPKAESFIGRDEKKVMNQAEAFIEGMVENEMETEDSDWIETHPRYGSEAFERNEALHPSEGYSTEESFDLF